MCVCEINSIFILCAPCLNIWLLSSLKKQYRTCHFNFFINKKSVSFNILHISPDFTLFGTWYTHSLILRNIQHLLTAVRSTRHCHYYDEVCSRHKHKHKWFLFNINAVLFICEFVLQFAENCAYIYVSITQLTSPHFRGIFSKKKKKMWRQ
jgi:hypothetical protein